MIQMETILGFDPLSKEIKVFEIDVTPSIAQYILIHHNKDNRKVTNSQINKIAKSIREDGWLRDGQPLTFNVDGNITEGQHRLNAIVAEDVTVPMIIVLGVELNCFTNTAPAKPRRPEDEIQRKDIKNKTNLVIFLISILVFEKPIQHICFFNHGNREAKPKDKATKKKVNCIVQTPTNP